MLVVVVDRTITAFFGCKSHGEEKVLDSVMPYYENQDAEDAKLVCKTLALNINSSQ